MGSAASVEGKYSVDEEEEINREEKGEPKEDKSSGVLPERFVKIVKEKEKEKQLMETAMYAADDTSPVPTTRRNLEETKDAKDYSKHISGKDIIQKSKNFALDRDLDEDNDIPTPNDTTPGPSTRTQLNSFDSFRNESNLDSILKNKKRQIHKNEDIPSPSIEDDTKQDEQDANPMEILFQFIPYYGQGDAATDSTVRATLKNLLVDDIDFRDENGNTLLLLACQYRCEDLVRIMLNKGADPNASNASGACCLHFACYKDSASKAIAKALLQNGANPEVKESSFGCTPLHYCASVGDLDFCKMLISYGALVSTRDNYSYTCVDYAREAGHGLIARYLQDSLLRANIGNSSAKNVLASGLSGWGQQRKKEEWIPQQDPDSGATYYYNSNTLECLWEEDYLARIGSSAGSHPTAPPGGHRLTAVAEDKVTNMTVTEGKIGDMKGSGVKGEGDSGNSPGLGSLNGELVMKAARIRLQTFFETNDIERLNEIDTLMTQYKGKEKDMLRNLCTQYGVSVDKELRYFADTLSRLEGAQGLSVNVTAGGSGLKPKSTPSPMAQSIAKRLSFGLGAVGGSSLSPQNMGVGMGVNMGMGGNNISEEVDMLRAQLSEMKIMYEGKLDEERTRGQAAISDREGSIAKLRSMLDALNRDKDSSEVEKQNLLSRLRSLTEDHSKTGTALEKEMISLQSLLDSTTAELSSTQSLLAAEREKLRSLENSLAMVTASDEERVLAERKAADERAAEQRDRDKTHAEELTALQERSAKATAKLRQELAEARNDFERKESELRSKFDEYRKNKEQEIERSNNEMAEFKEKMAKQLSSAQQTAEAAQRKAEESEKKLQELQEANDRLEAELNEARPLIALNAQLFRDLAREQAARKRLHNEMEDLKGKIRVYVRIRPMSHSEADRGCDEAVLKDGKISVMVRGVGGPDQKKVYDFDQIFGGSEGNSQEDVFRDTKHLCMSVVDGYNVCIFAYGQTGSGKTFTMMGSADIATCISASGSFDASAGILPRAVAELYRLLKEREAQVIATVEVQMFQLYRDNLEDLLHGGMTTGKKKKNVPSDEGPPNLKIVLAEHSASGLVEVEGAERIVAETTADVMRIVAFGSSRRTTASTQMNSESSRSHLICVLVVRLENRRTKSVTLGKLTLVDLAGSERVDKSGATGEVLKEAQSINKSLSALGGVIAALTAGNAHIPYRDHALTMLMSDSIGGNAKTLMFVNCSPADYNNIESNNSLAFAARCKDITNSVAGPQAAGQQVQINALKKELAKLKKAEKVTKAPKLEGLR